jgi:hypothetical protein
MHAEKHAMLHIASQTSLGPLLVLSLDLSSDLSDNTSRLRGQKHLSTMAKSDGQSIAVKHQLLGLTPPQNAFSHAIEPTQHVNPSDRESSHGLCHV